MNVIKIPRVCVHIPGETSREKFVPEYEFPLFQKIYRGRIADPHGDPLRIVPHPPNMPYSTYWYEVEADSVEEVCQIEATRLREAFGMDDANKDTVFDSVYPGVYFDEVVTKAITEGAKHASDPTRAEPETAIVELCSTVGIDKRTARKLADMGWNTAEAISSADELQLSKIIGKVKTAHLIKAAEAELGVLVNATPAEIIARAKVSKK